MFFFYILTLAGTTFTKAWVLHTALIGWLPPVNVLTPYTPYPFRALRAMAKSSNGKWQ